MMMVGGREDMLTKGRLREPSGGKSLSFPHYRHSLSVSVISSFLLSSDHMQGLILLTTEAVPLPPPNLNLKHKNGAESLGQG